MKTRQEHDSLGTVEVAADAYWGAQTERSRRMFSAGLDLMPREVVHALALCKLACARANRDLGVIDDAVAGLIEGAAREIIDGVLDDHFPLHVWQTGSGTQSNMNINEVIANRANELAGSQRGSKTPVHPNDHVNASQSSNDIFPSAMHLACVAMLEDRLLPALDALATALAQKAEAFAGIVKVGRTHLQDATPITLGQEFSGYVRQVREGGRRVRDCLRALRALPVGGTAVGTGLNAPADFGDRVCASLAELTGRRFYVTDNRFEAMAAHDAVVEASAALRNVAMSLFKIANDLRWLGSGPRCGLGELRLPANEPGSSIMPGKVNPTQCEALMMIATRVFGNDATVAFAGSQGNLELSTFKPVMIHAVLDSARLLDDGCTAFRKYLVEGLAADEARIASHLEKSLMLVTALAPKIGYDKAADIARAAEQQGLTLREAATRSGMLTEAQFDEWVQPAAMTHPG